MPANAPDYEDLTRVARILREAGFEPVLIGGLAMAVHGSTRATRDADYAIEKTGSAYRNSVRAMIDAGYGVIFGWNDEEHEPLPAGVKSDDAAVSWAVAEQPESVWFWNPAKRIRIDLIYDHPFPFEQLRAHAQPLSIAGQPMLLAAPKDLLRMKEASMAARTNRFKRLSDEQDIVFLRGILGG